MRIEQSGHDENDGFWWHVLVIAVFAISASFIIVASVLTSNNFTSRVTTIKDGAASRENGRSAPQDSGSDFKVLRVVDGDTIAIDYYGREQLVRLIGIDTPEVDGPYAEAECFGNNASEYMNSILADKYVTITSDGSQDNKDKYDRLLRYVSLDGEDVGEKILRNGYGYEYLYSTPYSKRNSYLAAQDSAKNNKKGLWGECVEQEISEPSVEPEPEHVYGENGDCNIKGNISISSGEKIYHVPGQEHYYETVISPEYGERWFCSEQEAIAAGWRKAKQ